MKLQESQEAAAKVDAFADAKRSPLAAASLSYADAAVAHLRQSDPIMAAIIERVGPLKIGYRRERFPALVRAIIFQQLAGRAAQTIHDRFVDALGGGLPTPEAVLAASDEILRGAGLSRGKMAYLRDLASHVQTGSLDFKRLPKLTDDEIVAHLTRVKGIGRWTAEMFMMFNLRRPDILPVDDLGVRMAVMKAYGMAEAPLPKQLREFGERWKPHRTAASWYLWQSLRLVTMEDAAAKAVLRATGKKSAAKPKAATEPASKGKAKAVKASSAQGSKGSKTSSRKGKAESPKRPRKRS
ncbi:MAG TPA: DNA-3-methyladenine glycosylase [Candidatus Binataceae bacterium]|nr:DNA-3-methyladenine glycosylase [Candidatus Binataceae bacterium]